MNTSEGPLVWWRARTQQLNPYPSKNSTINQAEGAHNRAHQNNSQQVYKQRLTVPTQTVWITSEQRNCTAMEPHGTQHARERVEMAIARRHAPYAWGATLNKRDDSRKQHTCATHHRRLAPRRSGRIHMTPPVKSWATTLSSVTADTTTAMTICTSSAATVHGDTVVTTAPLSSRAVAREALAAEAAG